MRNTNRMRGHHEAVPSDVTKMPKKLLPENRRTKRQMARFLKDRYFWYIAALAVFVGIFTYAPDIAALGGLAPREGWELAYYVALYRFLFLVSVTIAAWRFGVKGGLAACFVLGPIILSPFIVSLWGPNAWLEIGVIIAGILFSWLIGRQGKMKRLLEENTEELRRQAARLSLEITQRKQVEEKIKRAAEEWRTTFDSITDFVSIHDKDFRLIRVNKAFAGAFKMKPAELIGKPCYEIVHGTNEPVPRCPHKVTLETKKPHMAEFFEPHLGIHLEIATSPIFNEKGEVVASVHLIRDITERKKMEEQLIVTDRLASVGELSSGIAHELNNPLTSVIGFSQLLLEKDVPDDVKEDVKIIYSEAQRTAQVVKNLLTFARKHDTEKGPVNINSIMEKVLELRAYEQKVSNIQVNTRFAPDLPEIMADYFQLQQVFLNIVINAEHFMIEANNRGTLTITTERVEDIIKASFADDGPGIAEENLRHLFDPFFTTKEVGKGTGLGLSICHGIITEHGGRIYAESEFGKGATFVVELPITTDKKGTVK
ncbi:Adaptive-response sensory-kinase SasA [subsurface metagenome]